MLAVVMALPPQHWTDSDVFLVVRQGTTLTQPEQI